MFVFGETEKKSVKWTKNEQIQKLDDNFFYNSKWKILTFFEVMFELSFRYQVVM